QNEVTGKKTSGTKTTLSALVDLSEGKTVKANVNLFTELEYARAKNLVHKEKFNVPAAKKRATKELLAVFGGKGDENLTATSLSLSDTGSAGTALLYASILLQGDLSAGKFGQRLSDAAELFATSGTLDDAETLAAMADWASKTDSTDNFAAIRENVKAMKLVETVPDFESALYAFWTDVYGLVECTDSLESTIKKNENKLSDNYGAGYACTAKHWHKATALDTELELCTGKMEGSFKEYKGGKSTEYYVCRTGTWQQITETQFELKECTEKRESEYVAAKSGEYFVCTGKQWLELDAVTYELKLCTEKRDMEIATTKKSGSYVCEWDGKKGSWREASDIEAELGVCGSKDVATGSIYRTNSDDYYLCASGKWEKSDKLSYELQDAGACTDKNKLDTYKTKSFGLYVCDNKEWREASDVESDIGICTEIRENEFQKTDDNFFYVCANNIWKEISELDYSVRKICSESVIGEKREIVDEDGVGTGEKLECTEKNGVFFWKQVLKCGTVEYNEDSQLCDTRDNQLYPFVTIGKQVWMAKNLNYRQASMTSYACDADKYGRLYTWGVAIDSAAIFSTTGKGCGYGVTCADITYRGICPKGWHLPSKSEWEDLLIHVGISNSAKELKATEGWDKPTYNGNDTWGFTALPGGSLTTCDNVGTYAAFWTSSNGNHEITAYHVYMLTSFSSASEEQSGSKGDVKSVRCIKDE
ncbi:MAG: hypothetical protein IJ734_05025, partial [Fibrobacter sp.]|nr:hypothetical protein [Fibrobacter sp.]